MRRHFSIAGHHLRGAHSATEREARLLFMSPGNPEEAPPSNPAIDRLLMREDLAKAQYAFPDVRARVDQYETRFRHIYTLLKDRPENAGPARQTTLTNEENTHQTRLGAILPEGYRRNNTTFDNGGGPMRPQVLNRFAIAMPTYSAAVAEQHSRATFRAANGTNAERSAARGELARIEATATREMRIMIIANEVDAEFRYTEGVIANLEQSSNFPGASLQAQLLTNSTNVLNTQINAVNRTDKLQTVQIAGYREPMTGQTFPGYHLLRVPNNVTVTFFEHAQPATTYAQGVEVVQLSGGVKYYKISTTFAQRLPVDRIRARVSPPEPARIATIEKDDVNNLIFSFQPEEEVKKKEEAEVQRNPEISVGPSVSMYTGGNGSIRITGGRDNGLAHAAVFIAHNGALHPVFNTYGGEIGGNFARGAQAGDRTVRYPDNESGVTITFHTDGTIDAVGGNDQRTGADRIQLGFACFRNPTDAQPVRPITQEMMRTIEVRKIGVQPPAHNFTDAEVQSNAEKEFVIQPPTETGRSRVWFPGQNDRLQPGTEATANGVRVRCAADGKIFVQGRAPAAGVPLWVDHGTQAKIPLSVSVERPVELPEIAPGPNITRYTGGRGTIDLNPQNDGLRHTVITIPGVGDGVGIRWDRSQGEVRGQLNGSTVIVRANGTVEVEGGDTPMQVFPTYTVYHPDGSRVLGAPVRREIQIRTVDVTPPDPVTTLAVGASQTFSVLDNAPAWGGALAGTAQDRDTRISADGTDVPLGANMPAGNGSGITISRDADGRITAHATGADATAQSVTFTFTHGLQTFSRQVRVEPLPAPPSPPTEMRNITGNPSPRPEIRFQYGVRVPSAQELKAEQDKKNKDAEDQKKKKAATPPPDDDDLSFAPDARNWSPTVLLSPEVSTAGPLKSAASSVTVPNAVPPINPARVEPAVKAAATPAPAEPIRKTIAEPAAKVAATPAPAPAPAPSINVIQPLPSIAPQRSSVPSGPDLPGVIASSASQAFNLPQNVMNTVLTNPTAQQTLKELVQAVKTAQTTPPANLAAPQATPVRETREVNEDLDGTINSMLARWLTYTEHEQTHFGILYALHEAGAPVVPRLLQRMRQETSYDYAMGSTPRGLILSWAVSHIANRDEAVLGQIVGLLRADRPGPEGQQDAAMAAAILGKWPSGIAALQTLARNESEPMNVRRRAALALGQSVSYGMNAAQELYGQENLSQEVRDAAAEAIVIHSGFSGHERFITDLQNPSRRLGALAGIQACIPLTTYRFYMRLTMTSSDALNAGLTTFLQRTSKGLVDLMKQQDLDAPSRRRGVEVAQALVAAYNSQNSVPAAPNAPPRLAADPEIIRIASGS